jgi:hypothetical protein
VKIANLKKTFKYRRSSFYAKILGIILLFLLFLPYIITSIFGNIGVPGPESSLSALLKEEEKQLAAGNVFVV